MGVHQMQQNEGITFGKGAHRLHGLLHSLISQTGIAMHDHKPVIAARHLRIDARRIAHGAHAVIAEMRHLLRDGDVAR